jgi:hypothetical protein
MRGTGYPIPRQFKKERGKNMMDYKLSEQSAEDQLNLFLEYYELMEEDIPETQKSAFISACKRIIKAIRLGRLEITNVDGIKIVQTLKNPIGESQTIEYGRIVGKAKIAMKGKVDDDYGKMYALLGSLSGLGEVAIQKLEGPDLSIAECLGLLFLQV